MLPRVRLETSPTPPCRSTLFNRVLYTVHNYRVFYLIVGEWYGTKTGRNLPLLFFRYYNLLFFLLGKRKPWTKTIKVTEIGRSEKEVSHLCYQVSCYTYCPSIRTEHVVGPETRTL